MNDEYEEIMTVFLEETEEVLKNTQSLLECWQRFPDDLNLVHELIRNLCTLKGVASMCGIKGMRDLSHHLEVVFVEIIRKTTIQITAPLQDIIQQSVNELEQMRLAILSGKQVKQPIALINQLQNALKNGNHLKQTTHTNSGLKSMF